MTVETSRAAPTEGLATGYVDKPNPNSLAAAQAAAQPPQSERPAWLPDNFKTPEDFAKSYKEIQGQTTKLAQELATLKKGGKTEGDQDGEAAEKLAAAGVPQESLQKWSETFWSTGEVPAEAYEELAKVGITKDIIDDYANTRKSLQEGQMQTVMNAGGGKENVEKMFAWAGQNLKDAEVEYFNSAFSGNDINAAIVAMEALKGRFEASEGRNPNLVSGGNVPGSDGSVFTSTAQVVQAMSDPRYHIDPAYRAEVEKKLGRSKVM
jgi:hypothetical protein